MRAVTSVSSATAPARTPRQGLGAWSNDPDDGVFGWYRYIQDFTGVFALDWLDRLAQPGDLVWEPFAGSGTTLVAAKTLGLDSVGYDVSPFMVDVARAKLDWSLPVDALRAGLDRLTDLLADEQATEPADAVLGRWADYQPVVGAGELYQADKALARYISTDVLARLLRTIGVVSAIEDPRLRGFFRLAAASVIVPASNMTFRPNICYKSQPVLDHPVAGTLLARSRQMLDDYTAVAGRGTASATVEVGDAREAGPPRADVILTSPPYPNDMEYVHQTRLELLLLEYVFSARELTSLKKQMISSSVKLVYRDNEWQKREGLEMAGVAKTYRELADTLVGRNWGWNAADMVAQYFGGMRRVCANWQRRLRPGGVAAVVIGDSAFNGVKVESDHLLAETAQSVGLDLVGVEPFRSRFNSKHDIELVESVVLLRRAS
jgi:DNA modification methylase